MKQKLTAFLLGLGISLGAQAAPLGVNPGNTALSEAKTLLGEPKSSPIPEARYQFTAPSGSGYSSVELYVGRQSKVVEIAQYNFEPATDAALLKTQLKQKDADLRYTLASGETCEIFLAIKARVILNKEGKAKAIEYLSNDAVRVLLSEVSPLVVDRSTPTGAYRAFVAALFSSKEADITATLGGTKSAAGLEATYLQTAKPTFLVALDGATVTIPATKAKAKDAIIKVSHPLYGTTEFVFIPSTDKGWLLSRVNGVTTPIEKTASTPRAALSLYLKTLYAKPIAPLSKPPEVSTMAAWGAEWHTTVEKMQITGISMDGTRATILLSGDQKSAQASLVQEGKIWRVTEIKAQK